MLARAEQVGVLARSDKLHLLRLAHDELGTVFDLFVLIGPAVGQGVARVVRPLDHFNQLAFDDVQDIHGHSSLITVGHCRRAQRA